jgi:uncharacterized membrane protein YkoI
MNRLYWVALSLIVLPSIVSAQEKTIAETDLSAPVQKVVREQSQGATIKGFTSEVEHGKTVYEAEVMVNGHTKDIEIDADGNINEIEEQVVMESLPDAVRTALVKKAMGGEITKVESLKKHGTLVAYEATILRKSKRSEIQVGPDGSNLRHEE